jgi:amino acid permease
MWTGFVCIMIHLYGYKSEVVFWEVYYKFIHDLIIIFFSLFYAYSPKRNPIGGITGTGFAAYFCAPIMIRLYLSIEYFEDYKAYRKAICEDDYKIALMMFVFFILLTIYFIKWYYEFRGRKRTTKRA